MLWAIGFHGLHIIPVWGKVSYSKYFPTFSFGRTINLFTLNTQVPRGLVNRRLANILVLDLDQDRTSKWVEAKGIDGKKFIDGYTFQYIIIVLNIMHTIYQATNIFD